MPLHSYAHWCYPLSMPSDSIYQLKITLKNIKPPIWRSILIPADATFRDLHEAIQLSFGWTDSHLHDFSTEKDKYRGLYIDRKITDLETLDGIDPWGEPPADERKVTLRERLKQEEQHIAYMYDFGDSWEHDIILEKILPRDKNMEFPACIAGKRGCPPDDCGGTGGYEHLIAILADPKHEEHADMLEWLGIENAEEFDPEEFDAVTANEMLRDGYAAIAG